MKKMSEHFIQSLEEKMDNLDKEAQFKNDSLKWEAFRTALLSGNSRGPYLADGLEYLADAMNGVDQRVSDVLLSLAGQANRERTSKDQSND